MLFVTVGTDVPFDRMVRVIDEWAGATGRTDVFAQIGNSTFQPRHITCARFVRPAEFARRLAASRVVIAHAGMGSILSALHAGKPILVMPRRLKFRETRNDHQVATAQHLLRMGKVAVAFDEQELREKLDNLDALTGAEPIGPHASPRLTDALRQFIHGRTVVDLVSPALSASRP